MQLRKRQVSWGLETPRHKWLFDHPAQLCITGTQIYWTDETQGYEGSQEDSVKRYLHLCNNRLLALIQLIGGSSFRN